MVATRSCVIGVVSIKRDTIVGGWNRRWSVLRTCCFGFFDPFGLLNMCSVRPEDKSNYMLRMPALLDHVIEVKRLMTLDDFLLIGHTADATWYMVTTLGLRRLTSSCDIGVDRLIACCGGIIQRWLSCSSRFEGLVTRLGKTCTVLTNSFVLFVYHCLQFFFSAEACLSMTPRCGKEQLVLLLKWRCPFYFFWFHPPVLSSRSCQMVVVNPFNGRMRPPRRIDACSQGNNQAMVRLRYSKIKCPYGSWPNSGIRRCGTPVWAQLACS